MLPSYWRDALAPHVAGRPWILAGEVLAATVGMARVLQALGAERVLCVGVLSGTGALPADEGFEQILIDLPVPADMMGSIHESERILCDPPRWVLEAVDRFDPRREARVIGTFLAEGRPQLGRPLFGPRRPAWNALEDKVVIDAAFQDAGLAVAPHRVVPANAQALSEAAREIDRGEGTVWAGDAREGFHGGATLTFWVRDEHDARAAAATLAARCDRARVMPFLEGIPCSIHGFVTPDGIAVFRPCEMLVLRRPVHPHFVYAQAATGWDPSPEGREQMRRAARTMGLWLREKVDYRGVFTIDGVMSREGFLPTELNPRFGAALMVQARKIVDLPLLLLHFAAIDGLPLDWRPAELEALVVGPADANRHVGFTTNSSIRTTESRPLSLAHDGAGWRLVPEGEPAQATGIIGPSAMGSYLRVALLPEAVVPGPSAAPLAVEMLAVLDRELGLGLGELSAALDLR